MNLIRHAACVILLVSAPLAAVGRQNITEKKLSTDPQTKPAAEQKGTLDPTGLRILSVLKQILELQTRFADENVRIAVQAEIADLLWNYDEPRARALLEGAFQAISSAKLTDRNPTVRAAAAQQRLWILRMMARHDWALALKLQQTIDAPSPPDSRSFSSDYNMYVITLSLLIGAGQNPGSDVQLMAQAVKHFAERGDVKVLIPLLRQIRSRDAKVADDLFVQALEKSRFGQPTLNDVRWLAWYLFPAFGDGVLSFSSGGPVARDPYEVIQISPGVLQQFFDLAYDTVSQLEASLPEAKDSHLDPRAYHDYAIQRLLVPYFDRFMPDRSAAFRARVEEVRRRVRPEDRAALAVNEPGTVQELLARAEGLAEQRQKDKLYEKAVQQAMNGRTYDQAATILEKINDETTRSRQREMLRERVSNDRLDEIRKAIQDGDIDRAEQMISGISDRNMRMWMFQTLVAAASRKDKARATEMLAEANRLAANIENGIDRSLQLISIARAAGYLDTNRGFEEMKLAIDEFNRAGVAPEWEKHEEIGTTSGSENGKMTSRVNVGVSALLGHPDFQWLGNTDFDRALTLAQQVQVREASAFAQLSVCRGALSKVQFLTPKKSIAPEKPGESNKAKQR